ncbi:MAG: tRNA (N6-threonylcarbamoyladenosine(37)-N6)-methyltransferase TrmO [Pseudomonadota bacterium]
MTEPIIQNGYWIRPVGYVEGGITQTTSNSDEDMDPVERKEQVRRHHEMIKSHVSTLTLLPEYEELLDGIEAFSHIIVFFWPHELDRERLTLKKVHPMGRKDIPLQGIFATRSPARPNPILMSPVRLIQRQGRQLRVQGLDALDQSPILDLKPVIRKDDGIKDLIVPEWILQIRRDLSGDE